MQKTKDQVKLASNLSLKIEKRHRDRGIKILLFLNSKKNCYLHWGVCADMGDPWQIPPRSFWPDQTKVYGLNAVQTPFTAHNNTNQLILSFNQNPVFSLIAFALYFPAENSWDNNSGTNYFIKLPKAETTFPIPRQALAEVIEKKEIIYQRIYHLAGESELAAAVTKEDERYQIDLITDIAGTLVLHWGVAYRSKYEWFLPPESLRPEQTDIADNNAAQSRFGLEKGLNRLRIQFDEKDAPLGLSFVLKQCDTGKWFKRNHANFYLPLKKISYEKKEFSSSDVADLAEDIIQAETGRNSWTLMHRFNLCHDLLDRVRHDVEGLVLLFVWLRFSAIRQLDWQRNYNTKPRELAHAQMRLTLKLASLYKESEPKAREILRLIMSTLGRGGEGGKGQKIRDDILHIMHRHKIKEVTGHFLEEWHQKLHNNATPDDIVICEAYLEFLRSNGDLNLFYKTLENKGVTRKRLESFERPITSEPDFVPHLKDGLIHDFENYLQLLKSIHSATDLASVINEPEYYLPEQLKDQVAHIHHSRDDRHIDVADRVQSITAVRHSINDLLQNENGEECIRNALYLDLALEEFLRVVVERDLHRSSTIPQLTALIGAMIENVGFSHDQKELVCCADHWMRLTKGTQEISRDWALQAKAALDRLTRLLSTFGDYYYELLQTKAQYLGNAFQADQWTIDLFSQEIVRAGSAFVLSLLINHIEPLLRQIAHLGSWQVISRAKAVGKVEVATLLSIQARKFKQPAAIITDKITGDEEIPEGVIAVISSDMTDILSHVSVRARNASILFAVCYDPDIIDDLKQRKGKILQLAVNDSGDVEYLETGGRKTANAKMSRVKSDIKPIKFQSVFSEKFAVSSKAFTEKTVGAKSLQLQYLQGKIPHWIHLPRSVAIPLGVCEKVFADKANASIDGQYKKLAAQVDRNPDQVLPQLQKELLALKAPEPLITSLQQVMTNEGLDFSHKWEILWNGIKRVWASKWNKRAYWSRRKYQVDHAQLLMAVLIQQVVEPEYAFVIHTANPFTGARDEIYGEMVPGLGETICSGNYPGRALGFLCKKEKKLKPEVVSYPSKHVALIGGGIICRSDSNGEDLEEYSGAGLYDSVLLEAPHEELINYTETVLIWDKDLRGEVLKNITKIGMEIENALGGCPQDIEGAYENGNFHVVQTRPQVGVK